MNTPDPYTEFNGSSLAPGAKPSEASATASSVQLAWTEGGPVNGGIHSRTMTFVGAVSGSAVVAKYSRLRSWNNQRGQFLWAVGGYQGSVDVTLVKQ